MNAPAIIAQIDTDPIAAFIEHAGGTPDTLLTRLPDYMQPGLVRFILTGTLPGSFLRSVLAGERELAELRADDTNAGLLDLYHDFLTNEAPADCWGTPDQVRAWHERGGLIGQDWRTQE